MPDREDKPHHIYKKVNGCLNVLEKVGCNQHVDFISYVTPQATTRVVEVLKFNDSETMCNCLVNYYCITLILFKKKKKSVRGREISIICR